MAGMQFDPVPDEPIKSPEEIDGFKAAVIPIHEGELRSDVSQEDEFRKLEQVVQMVSHRRQKAKYSLQGRATSAYELQKLLIDQTEVIGNRFNKAS